MHIKKSNYDILNFDHERRRVETVKQQPVSSLASDVHGPLEGYGNTLEHPGLFRRIRSALSRWLKPAASP
ncbi:hypothetical protein [Pseudomonas huaxiensis]|uniref:hypothetical protein n=1 Tax=Pseudomonas huaxiensis TaxID=2213017 RepID=UPI0013007C7F|nr:hypothetical protein [Pseudomonas huaxiensis]